MLPPSSPVAIVMTAWQQVELQPVPVDDTPLGPTEVTGPTWCSLVSPGTELAGYQGATFPVLPGYAAVFQVAAVGSAVHTCQPGDVVFAMGAHRSWQRVPATEVIVLPTGLAPEQAVFARMMAVSMSTLTTTVARPPARVVIMGLGLVGNLAAQVFARCGYQVLGCDPVAERRTWADAVGIATVATAPLTDPTWAGQVALVIDCSGHEQAVIDGCALVRKRGEVVLTGVPWKQRSDASAHTLLAAIFQRYVVVRSGWEWEIPVYPTEFRQNSIWENLTAALAWLAADRITVTGMATVFSPQECQPAYTSLTHPSTPALTVVFDWRHLAA